MPSIKSKDIQAFTNDLKKLNASIDDITDNVDGINNQFEDYNEQISTIKDNVKSLENELKNFINDVKISPLLEEAKDSISKLEDELKRKYEKHNLVRDKFIEIINNISNNEIESNLLINNNEFNNINIPNYYLSYVLMAVISWINNNKKSCNKYIQQAIEINKEKTALALLTLYTKINKTDIALKWLKYYLDLVDFNNSNTTIVKVLQLVQNNEILLNEVISRFNNWSQNLNENDYNIIKNAWIDFLGLNKNYINDNYSYIYEHCNSNKLIQELNDSYAYSNSYNKIIELLNNYSDYDISKDLICIPEEEEKTLQDEIAKNKAIVKNNGKKNEKKTKLNENVFVTLIDSLSSKKYNKKTKEYLLNISKKYILNLFDDNSNISIDIIIGNWTGSTVDGSNENKLINDITEYVKIPFKKDISNIKLLNYKTIYALIFLVVGLIISYFNFTIGAATAIVGMGTLFYFMYDVKQSKKDVENIYNETLDTYILELEDTLAEIVDINFIINKNNMDKNKLINYLKNTKGGKNE